MILNLANAVHPIRGRIRVGAVARMFSDSQIHFFCKPISLHLATINVSARFTCHREEEITRLVGFVSALESSVQS
jgi:hypothetical protein